MDYEHLYQILPKSHWHWTVKDTLLWLDYIGMQNLSQKFCNPLENQNRAQSMEVFFPV